MRHRQRRIEWPLRERAGMARKARELVGAGGRRPERLWRGRPVEPLGRERRRGHRHLQRHLVDRIVRLDVPTLFDRVPAARALQLQRLCEVLSCDAHHLHAAERLRQVEPQLLHRAEGRPYERDALRLELCLRLRHPRVRIAIRVGQPLAQLAQRVARPLELRLHALNRLARRPVPVEDHLNHLRQRRRLRGYQLGALSVDREAGHFADGVGEPFLDLARHRLLPLHLVLVLSDLGIAALVQLQVRLRILQLELELLELLVQFVALDAKLLQDLNQALEARLQILRLQVGELELHQSAVRDMHQLLTRGNIGLHRRAALNQLVALLRQPRRRGGRRANQVVVFDQRRDQLAKVELLRELDAHERLTHLVARVPAFNAPPLRLVDQRSDALLDHSHRPLRLGALRSDRATRQLQLAELGVNHLVASGDLLIERLLLALLDVIVCKVELVLDDLLLVCQLVDPLVRVK